MSVITQFKKKREDFLLSCQHSRTSLTWVGSFNSPVAAMVKFSLRHPSSVSRGRCHSEAQNNMFFILSHTHTHTHKTPRKFCKKIPENASFGVVKNCVKE